MRLPDAASGVARYEWFNAREPDIDTGPPGHSLAEALGRELRLRQANHPRSHAGVLRGFHTEPWDKLVYVVRDTARCVVADVRPDSPSFARTERFTLGDPPGEHLRLFVSQGLSNAFYCFSETDYVNDVSAEFDPTNRRGVAWNDPTLAVEWPTSNQVLSGADANQPTLQSLFANRVIGRTRTTGNR